MLSPKDADKTIMDNVHMQQQKILASLGLAERSTDIFCHSFSLCLPQLFSGKAERQILRHNRFERTQDFAKDVNVYLIHYDCCHS